MLNSFTPPLWLFTRREQRSAFSSCSISPFQMLFGGRQCSLIERWAHWCLRFMIAFTTHPPPVLALFLPIKFISVQCSKHFCLPMFTDFVRYTFTQLFKSSLQRMLESNELQFLQAISCRVLSFTDLRLRGCVQYSTKFAFSKHAYFCRILHMRN